MKDLRKFALNLDRRDWPNDHGYLFYLRSRPLCNFIERHLKTTEVRIVDSTKLAIRGRKASEVEYFVNSSNVACLGVPFENRRYARLRADGSIHAFIVEFAREKLRSLPDAPSNEVRELDDIISQFEGLGYVNEWRHCRKTSREHGLEASLDCCMTLSCFKLMLVVHHNGELTHSKTILRTDPDETAFHYRFKDLRFSARYLTVTSRQTEPLLRIPIGNLKTKTST